MDSARQQGFGGPNPVSLTDIANWTILTGNLVRREEVEIIRAMDAAYLSTMANEQADAAERAKNKKD